MWLGHVLRHESLLHNKIEGRVKGKAMHLLSDLMTGKRVALNGTAEDKQRVAEIVKSWKLYTCFSADYLNE